MLTSSRLRRASLVVMLLSALAGFVWMTVNPVRTINEVELTDNKTPSQVKLPNGIVVKSEIYSTTDPASIWVVVNKKYPLSDLQYRPADLVLPSVPTREDKSLDERSVRRIIVPELTTLFGDAEKQGFSLMIASGFRNPKLQQAYFDSYSATHGARAANQFSAVPGQSEHQTGLALDIAYTDMADCYLDTCFGDRPAGKWLAEHAHNYGFVLRYPGDKTSITQYQYEPWHFRYVGRPLAEALFKNGLTLDEARPYLERKKPTTP